MKKRIASITVLIVIYAIFHYYYVHVNDSNSIGKRLESDIEETLALQEKQGRQLFDQIQNEWPYLSHSNPSDDIFNERIDNNDFFYFLFKGDSLLFWSTISVEPTEIVRYLKNNNPKIVRLSNGWFSLSLVSENEISLVSLFPIYFDYSISNSLLRNGFNEQAFPYAHNMVIDTDDTNGLPIQIDDKTTIFHIVPSNIPRKQLFNWLEIWIFILFLVILSTLYNTISWVYKGLSKKLSDRLPLILFQIIDISIIQIIIRLVYSNILFIDNEWFNVSFLGSGWLLPSIGITIIHAQAIYHIALLVAKIDSSRLQQRPYALRATFALFGTLLFVICIYLAVFFVELVFYNASSIFSLNHDRVQNSWNFVIIIVGSLLHFSFVLMGLKLLRISFLITNARMHMHAFFLLIMGVSIIVVYENSLNNYISIIYIIFLYLLYAVFSKPDFKENAISRVLFVSIFGAAILMTYMAYDIGKRKTIQELELTALKLGEERDPLLEFLFPEIIHKIDQDTTLRNILSGEEQYALEDRIEIDINQYIRSTYFSDYFSKYSVNLTICDKDQSLIIQPNNYTIPCYLFFNDLVKISGTEIIENRLYLIDDNVEGLYYLFLIPVILDEKSGESVNIYMEFYFKYIPEGLGYPDLLIDQSKGFTQDFANYSFANYNTGVLNYKFGSYFYPTFVDQLTENQKKVFKRDGYLHLLYVINDQKSLVVSKKAPSTMGVIAPFSYFLLLFAIFSFVTVLFINKNMIFAPEFQFSFRLKLQLILIVSLLLSFVIIGISSTYYFTNIYKSKNKDFLTEKTQSILIELEHKLKNEDLTEEGMSEYLQQLLQKFSLVFFSDINIYHTSGQLLATSRPEVFKQKLIAPLMEPNAYREMHVKKRILYVHQEQIGNSSYMSSYVPFKNAGGESVAYINLPFFARESEMRTEISALILTYLNIFLLLASFAVALALLLSRRLTQPLQMIQKKMQLVRIDKVNEKIIWSSRDEIGQLVNQYNKLLDQLQESAEILAKSERESAWRDMAKQVAHEIKNPLTPMRLSIQYLEKAWNENDPDIEKKFKNTTQTIINQIDTLSSIASAFSDFAKMPANQPGPQKVSKLVDETILLFSSHQDLSFRLVDLTEGDVMIHVDKNNFQRALTNLIKNSIQAIGKKAGGWVLVEISVKEGHCNILVSDNGKGMSKDEMSKVFTPNFTTKSSGMGLGLSMVKNIIEAAGGTITFTSLENEGSTFIISIPVMQKSDNII